MKEEKKAKQKRTNPMYGTVKISELKSKCKSVQRVIANNREEQFEESVKVFKDTMLIGC